MVVGCSSLVFVSRGAFEAVDGFDVWIANSVQFIIAVCGTALLWTWW